MRCGICNEWMEHCICSEHQETVELKEQLEEANAICEELWDYFLIRSDRLRDYLGKYRGGRDE